MVSIMSVLGQPDASSYDSALDSKLMRKLGLGACLATRLRICVVYENDICSYLKELIHTSMYFILHVLSDQLRRFSEWIPTSSPCESFHLFLYDEIYLLYPL